MHSALVKKRDLGRGTRERIPNSRKRDGDFHKQTEAADTIRALQK